MTSPGTPMGIPRAANRRCGLGALVLVVALASACGGGTTSPSSSATGTGPVAPSSPSSAAVGDPTQRPEGAWTLVTWPIKRSDTKDFQPIANISHMMITPSCAQGPCDLAFSPAKSGDSAPEAAPTGGAEPSNKPMEFRWDGTSYVASTASHEDSCIPKVGVTVAKGYTTSSSLKLNFVSASGDAPARVHGIVIETATGTKAGKGKGCRDFTETRAVGGSPTGSLDPAALPQGTYSPWRRSGGGSGSAP